MSGDRRYREDQDAITCALFRYQVIAPIVEQAESASRGEVSARVREAAEQTHYRPGHGPVRVAERTVYQWLRDYRQGGIEALRPRRRKDRGERRALSDELLEQAIALRKEVPKRTTKTLLDILRRAGRLGPGPAPHRATLDRHLRMQSASRRQLKVLGQKPTIKMLFEDFGELWVGDYHHGPVVLAPNGEPTTAKLAAFIDHATRYPVADRYYLGEDLATLRDCLLRALLRWGPRKGGKVYVDRGAVYRAEQLAYSLLRLDVKLVHSRPYYSQGRGVIEKWWQHATDFEAEVAARDELLTVHELNRLWEAWRTLRYLDEPHEELGCTPNEAIAEVTPRPLDPDLARELFLVKADRTVHKSDGCVAVEGRRFVCESFLRGRRVEVRYDPRDLGSVLVFVDGERVQRAFPQMPGAKPHPHPEPTPEPAGPPTDYLAQLRDDFDQQLIEHARPLRYAEIEHDPAFDGERFVETVGSLAGLPLRRAERAEITALWERFGPLPESLVRIAVEHAVRLHGRGRHVRVYLHAVRTLVLAHWRSGGEKPDTEDPDE